MRKLFCTLLLALCAAAGINAQVVNYAIELDEKGTVNCGLLPELDGKSAFTIQLWMKPTEWLEGATLLSRGEDLRISLGQPGVVNFTVGESQLQAKDVATDGWSLVSLRVDDSKAYVNGVRSSVSVGKVAKSDEDAVLILGGGFKGRIDEVRIWGTSLTDDFNRFEHTTLNNYNPDWADLLVYYKMDQELCPNLVDYKGLYTHGAMWNHHGVFSAEGVKRVVSDNDLLPYLINSAYTANERFYDRSIPRDQYLFANDLIILGIESTSDGHLHYATPNCHATLQGSATRVDEFEGREGVMRFDLDGSLDCGAECLNSTRGYTFETWLYLEEWTEGAYIFRKETQDGLNGFSISLGNADKKELVVRVNGHTYTNSRLLPTGKWTHLAIITEGGSNPDAIFALVLNGSRIGSCYAADGDDNVDYVLAGVDDCHAILGEGLKGYMDNVCIWSKSFGRNEFASHMESLPMPGLDKTVTSDILQAANTLLTFDDNDNPGYDSYSQDHWRDIMTSAYEGHRGYKVRISVKSHSGWETTISDPAKRKIFAADLARLSEGYDGVELDLEWIYGLQTSLGLLSDDIREALPEGKTFMISCHNVAYQFPKEKMDNCDGFTFQQYGPQGTHSYYNTFVSYTTAFVNYGFPREKILCSYATTTSEGHINGSRPAGAPPIKGVRDGFMDEGFTPDPEVDYKEINGYTYYFDGPLQTYRRAKYVTDQRLGGIFYWDMGNDVRPDHRYNLAKWSTYGLNANVDTLVTSVEVDHFDIAGIEDVAAASKATSLKASVNDGILTLEFDNGGEATDVCVYNLSGLCVARADKGERVDISRLPAGHYVVRACERGSRQQASARFVRL